MFGLRTGTQVFVRPGITDLRLHYEGLQALVVNEIQAEPLSGHLFCFCNRARNRVRCLIWDGSGFWVCTKRLERATFDWPRSAEAAVQMTITQLELLISGLEIRSRRGWYRREEKLVARAVSSERVSGAMV
jgi:transposase